MFIVEPVRDKWLVYFVSDVLVSEMENVPAGSGVQGSTSLFSISAI